jgi:hypothetical protein
MVFFPQSLIESPAGITIIKIAADVYTTVNQYSRQQNNQNYLYLLPVLHHGPPLGEYV